MSYQPKQLGDGFMGGRRSTGTGRRGPLSSLLPAVVGSSTNIDYDHCLGSKYVVYATIGEIRRLEEAATNKTLQYR